MLGKVVTEKLGPDEPGLERAAAILRSGGVVALPTETVYGLAARADCAEAVAKIYEAKGRPSFNPLIVHVHSLEQARTLAKFNPNSLELAADHWPGPLTLVLPRRRDATLADAIAAGLPTVALRCPAHAVMRRVIELVDAPLAAPSANRSGFVSPTTANHVLATLDGRIDAVVDGGPTAAGIESTIVAVRPDGRREVLRPGPILLGEVVAGIDGQVEAPGQLSQHYAPGKPVRLNVRDPDPDEFMIGFGAVDGVCSLSDNGDLEVAAARLYACLHDASGSSLPRIAIAPIPEDGIGRAINDRLRRAAS
ncbi:L-threonylcarbamoyladenylate synthase [Qipengyuania sp.]|uniref:L-threonylcarbamoyladenylate synthase n=1 Tax=Qipengyuania sp. TaxID=2004515 RepID=UPI0035C83DF3